MELLHEHERSRATARSVETLHAHERLQALRYWLPQLLRNINRSCDDKQLHLAFQIEPLEFWSIDRIFVSEL